MTLEERFLKYVKIPTMSDEASETLPSSKKQLVLGGELINDLSELGIPAYLDDFGYVYGSLASNCGEEHPSVAFIAHMDTSDAAPDSVIKPSKILYDGGEVTIGGEARTFPDEFIGLHLIVTDGTTLLGADDKAGIAEIMNALERLVKSGEKHGNIKICFTPDEEIGRGADNLSLGKLGADYGYTFDGGALGGIEYENFNAAGATVNFTGFSVHPGDAYGKMKNAALIAAEFTSLLPRDEVPEKTKGYEGFFHLTDMSGSIEHACLKYIIRDHDRAKFEEKKKFMENAVKTINEKYGEGTASAEIKDSYYNMREIIEKNPDVLERAREAMREEGVAPYSSPIRGGTDGARLSFMGLPCPNLCTGGHMYHSRHEYAVLEHMEKCADIALRLMTDTVKYKNGKN